MWNSKPFGRIVIMKDETGCSIFDDSDDALCKLVLSKRDLLTKCGRSRYSTWWRYMWRQTQADWFVVVVAQAIMSCCLLAPPSSRFQHRPAPIWLIPSILNDYIGAKCWIGFPLFSPWDRVDHACCRVIVARFAEFNDVPWVGYPFFLTNLHAAFLADDVVHLGVTGCATNTARARDLDSVTSLSHWHETTTLWKLAYSTSYLSS